MKPRLGAALAILYLGFSALAGVVLIVISSNFRSFFVSRGASEIGDSFQLMMVAMALVLWSSALYFVWRADARVEATFK